MITVSNYNDNGKIEHKQYNLQSVHALSIMTFMSSPFSYTLCRVTLGDDDALEKQRRIK